jgi:ABC-type nickel/cobalt efflux system permease component RcnA
MRTIRLLLASSLVVSLVGCVVRSSPYTTARETRTCPSSQHWERDRCADNHRDDHDRGHDRDHDRGHDRDHDHQ